ncbi:hypothetical protein CDL12_07714 [Handroanthus impetiginosus]|uniref:B box-type domain-containing protein n=1 Tax=Handroanthus impetiginosus TaxID=429701 RepID=A0A2G9HQ07_9LAMI|nr:hypothetical protein CDL12_18459 [Handroanthus impetiginosus]PIN19612.1 hypothetical protein CDL12_07714 [Handroanthus impetiginosus]
MSEIPKLSPAWLFTWLQIPFYEEKCHVHIHKYNTIFCGVCMKEPVCEICWKEESMEHQDHIFLQVRAASRRTAIEMKDIKKLLDISYIQHYKVNSKDILYLRPNFEGGGEQKQNPKCEICKRKLITHDYKFCSIICKFKSLGYSIEKMKSVDSKSTHSTATDESTMNILCSSKRIKINHRKGIPRRAPLQ